MIFNERDVLLESFYIGFVSLRVKKEKEYVH